MTTDQVVAALGKPATTYNSGAKAVYVYKNMKVTFTDGKVSDMD
jgi:hypothetical protein